MENIENTWSLRVVDWDGDDTLPTSQQVLSFTHGLWTPAEPGAEPEIQDLAVVLEASAAMPRFIALCTGQKRQGKLVLEMVEQRGAEEGLRLRYEVFDARVTAVRPGGTQGKNRPLYELSMEFKQLVVHASELSWKSEAQIDGYED